LCAACAETGAEMKKVVSGGPVRAVAVTEADAGLPDTIPLN
jgi:hypothetical protein